MRCSINVVVWQPDGRRCISGAQTGEITLWRGQDFSFESVLQVGARGAGGSGVWYMGCGGGLRGVGWGGLVYALWCGTWGVVGGLQGVGWGGLGVYASWLQLGGTVGAGGGDHAAEWGLTFCVVLAIGTFFGGGSCTVVWWAGLCCPPPAPQHPEYLRPPKPAPYVHVCACVPKP